MVHFKTSVLIVAVCFFNLICASLNDDYCWKDYVGTKPSKSLNAGLDKAGRVINIGQVLTKMDDILMVGEVYENEPFILYELGGVRNATENIKVLCTDHPTKFEWYPTHFSKVENLTDKILFSGTYMPGFDIYVGRKFVDAELRVGKIVCGVSCDSFRLVHFNGSTTYHEEFEILTYNDSGN